MLDVNVVCVIFAFDPKEGHQIVQVFSITVLIFDYLALGRDRINEDTYLILLFEVGDVIVVGRKLHTIPNVFILHPSQSWEFVVVLTFRALMVEHAPFETFVIVFVADVDQPALRIFIFFLGFPSSSMLATASFGQSLSKVCCIA